MRSPLAPEPGSPPSASPAIIGRASAALALVAASILATWAPHYLTWPWWLDVDAWTTMAQGWDAGLVPYRDFPVFNFPGQILACRILGRAFGWGRTTPFYALDLGLLLLLGVALILWGRRCFGRALPGLVAFVVVLAIDADLDYAHVAQRDWQGPLLVAVGLLAIQALPGWRGWLPSAWLVALAFAIRPHVLLFLPALALAIIQESGPPWRDRARALAGWSLAFLFGVALAFAPLIADGLLDDLARGIRIVRAKGGYDRTTFPGVLDGVLRQLGLPGFRPIAGPAFEIASRLPGWKVALALAAEIGLIARAAPSARRLAGPWTLAFLAALAYRPLHPIGHAYLGLPLRLFFALNLAIVAELVLQATARRPTLGLVAVVALVALGVPGLPRYCRPFRSVQALADLARPVEPATVPPGAEGFFAPENPLSPYRWSDYRATLAYLRRATGPGTRVANLLRNPPFPALNGPTGRISPLPAESGIIWLWRTDPDDEPAFVAALERSPDSVVVWAPDEPIGPDNPALPRLVPAVRRLYTPEARFGVIEIWRRKVNPPQRTRQPGR